MPVLVTLILAVACIGCGEDSPSPSVQQPEISQETENPQPLEDPQEPEALQQPEASEEPEILQFGAVTGFITDASTGNPIPWATVTLLDQTVEVERDGRYVFQQIGYAEALRLTIEAGDYETQTEDFVLDIEHLRMNVSLNPLTDSDAEIRQFFDTFSGLIQARDINNLGAIQAHFSEVYLVSDDPVTRFGLATGVIPEKAEKVIPSMTKLFEEFDAIQFRFHDIQVDVTHSRKASARLNLDVITEKGPRPDRNEITAECRMDFRKETLGWKIIFWQLFKVDIHL
ncbi:MAG: carboxypeptidase-like regulatory domain-containing protein [Candidatus Poribacteria bacterium]|nr:carboxypeptidase-like regulatory domain-containing protein [Candidatus Poribacteria bacterium]